MKTNNWYKLTLKLFNEMCFMPSTKSYSIVIYDTEDKDVIHANYFPIDKDRTGMDRLTFVDEYDEKCFMLIYSLAMSLEKNWEDGWITCKELEKEMNKKWHAYISIVMEEDPA